MDCSDIGILGYRNPNKDKGRNIRFSRTENGKNRNFSENQGNTDFSEVHVLFDFKRETLGTGPRIEARSSPKRNRTGTGRMDTPETGTRSLGKTGECGYVGYFGEVKSLHRNQETRNRYSV